MGKKKKGGNKKNKGGGGRGGGGGGAAGGKKGPSKEKQETPTSSVNTDVVDISRSNSIGDIKIEPPVKERVKVFEERTKAADNEEGLRSESEDRAGADIDNDASNKTPENGDADEAVPSSKEIQDTDESITDKENSNAEADCTESKDVQLVDVEDKADDVAESTQTQECTESNAVQVKADGVAESTESQDAPLSDDVTSKESPLSDGQNPSLENVDSANATSSSLIKLDEKEPADAGEDKAHLVAESNEPKDSPMSHGQTPAQENPDTTDASSINLANKEPDDAENSVDCTKTKDRSVEDESLKVDSTNNATDGKDAESKTVDSTSTSDIETKSPSTADNKVLEGMESFSETIKVNGDIGSPKILSRLMNKYPSQLSTEMEEVDLDSSLAEKSETASAPMVRAYNGSLNGISPATGGSLSFAFEDSNEGEAFLFLTASLRKTLDDHANNNVADETLSRYIRWKPDVKRAAERYRANQTFRKENPYIFDGDKPLLLSQDPKLTFLIQNGFVMAPEELVAKDGSGVMIIRGAKCHVTSHACDDQDASRAIFYILQRMLERNTLDPLKGITIILDLEGATRKNNPRKLSNLLSKAAGCFPLRIQAIFVVSMPWWFPAAANKKLFSAKMRSRIHFLKDKGALHEYIEKDRLLEEYGGIYNFDLQSWISSTFLNEVEGSLRGLS